MTYFIEDKQQFHQYQNAFKQLAHDRTVGAEDHILYNLIRGHDLKLGFTPIKRESKLDPYYKDPFREFHRALSNLRSDGRWLARTTKQPAFRFIDLSKSPEGTLAKFLTTLENYK